MSRNKIRIYDNGGKTLDRYTIVFMQDKRVDFFGETAYGSVSFSEDPFSANGFYQHGDAIPGRHLGKRIRYENASSEIRAVIKYELMS